MRFAGAECRNKTGIRARRQEQIVAPFGRHVHHMALHIARRLAGMVGMVGMARNGKSPLLLG